MSIFAQTAKATSSSNRTVNKHGVSAYKSTGTELIDYFSKSGALRGNDAESINLFANAFAVDNAIALATLLYTRDPRDGLGERQSFRAVLKWLCEQNSPVVKYDVLAHYVPKIGRWDDLEAFFDTPQEHHALSTIKAQHYVDISAEKPSLLAKWLPMENASSKQTKQFAYKIIRALNTTPRAYRKTVVAIRKKLNLVESNLSRKNYEKIVYSQVPSKANMLYNAAFLRNDETRRRAFLASLTKGETKINASVAYPYEILYNCITKPAIEAATFNEMWKALPNYVNGENPVLVMMDVSGSMHNFNYYGTKKLKVNYGPIHIATSLGIYFAERNKGPFKDLVMSFVEKPKFINLNGSLIGKNQRCIEDVGYSTNLNAAFTEILTHAEKHKVLAKDMPRALVVISDMQMNEGGKIDYQKVKTMFSAYGYEAPKLVWWNVNAQESSPDYAQDGVVFVSGASATVFKSLLKVLNNETVTPMDQVTEALKNFMPTAVKMLVTK